MFGRCGQAREGVGREEQAGRGAIFRQFSSLRVRGTEVRTRGYSGQLVDLNMGSIHGRVRAYLS